MAQTARIQIADNAAAAASKLDPVVGAAIELAKLWERNDSQTRDIWDLISAYETLVISQSARSMPGALAQLSILAARIDSNANSVINEEILMRDFRAMERIASSIANVLREHAGGVDPLGHVYRGVEGDASPRPLEPGSSDPVLHLIELHRWQHADSLARECDEESDAAADIAFKTWWELMDTQPTTQEGAIALARYVAEMEGRQECPTTRVRGDVRTEENVSLIALRRLVNFLGGDQRP